MARRPEHIGPPELFYSDVEAKKYTNNSRINEIQVEMCNRALELLLLPEDKTCLLLDIGCGSAISGSVLDNHKHNWIGLDISPSMLSIALDRDVGGDLLLTDMGQGLPLKTGCFDGAISISALQWLCNVDKKNHIVKNRLNTFFTTLFSCLSTGARAVFQFYPENDEQIDIITASASKAGFYGGIVIDFPNSKKAKKFFLVLMTGGITELPKGLTNLQTKSHTVKRQENNRKKKIPMNKKGWIMKKKNQFRVQGKKVKNDSRYSGRKRKNQ